MQQHHLRPPAPPARRADASKRLAGRLLLVALCVAALGAAPAARAFEFGPLSLTGFVKAGISQVSNGCEGCQRDPRAARHFIWADDIAFGKKFGDLTTDSVQVQPTLGVKIDLPEGFKLSAAYSQRWRDGKPDLEGVVYERSATLSHEYYGTVMIGNFLSRGWNRADFPYASDVGQTAFSDSGAAYGNQIGTAYEVSGGVRFNRWSGAYAVPLTTGPLAQWNNPFNVDWGGVDANGVPNPGYPARSTDFMLGLRKYVDPKLVAHTGLTYLGKASTDNPSERGQSNSALFATVGATYDVGSGLSVSGSLNGVWYARKGLAPLSMPAHHAFSNVDSRVAKRGNWVSIEANYRF
ncbi:MAG: hypothetical protein Fur0014_01830 [Rubrivivax sp.]